MKRTFNYTGRKKIERSDVTIRLRRDGDFWSFDADLRLSIYKFQQNAEVWIEAHRQDLWMQWQFGTVAALKAPTDRRLNEFGEPAGVLFRVRVVQPQGQEHHKLLGEAEGIHFLDDGESEQNRNSLFPTAPDSLHGPIWRVGFDEEDGHPILLVEKNAVPSWKEVARRPEFMAFVYPELVRQVMSKILIEDQYSEDDEDDGDEWKCNWIRYARHLGVSAPIPEKDANDDRKDWINNAVSVFCDKHSPVSIWERQYNEIFKT